MANTKYVLEQIRLEGALQNLIAKSDGENVAVSYNGAAMTLASALAAIYSSVSALPTGETVDSKISMAIDALIGGAPETYDTLKKISDYISQHGEAAAALTSQIGQKVDKVEGKGLSTEDFTTALKTKLENMAEVTAEEKAAWDAKASTAVATADANGLMSKEDKARLDALRGVRYGAEPPADMQDGELFVRVISEA